MAASLGAVAILCSTLRTSLKDRSGFNQAEHVIGTYDYHFFMMGMKPIKRRNGKQYLHRESKAYRDASQRKMNAYHVFMFMGVVSQGLMQYLSAYYTDTVMASFGSWLRTIRKGVYLLS